MRPTATVRQFLISATRPAALAAIAVTIAVVGSLSLGLDSAHAQPVIEVEGACDPSPVRPSEPALVSCTVRITNAGDETATSLVGDLFIADGCDIPGRFSFIDRTIDGELVAMGPLDLSVEIGDLAPGDSMESVTRIAAEHFAPGRSGGALTVRSLEDPALNAVIDLCWDVEAGAAAPPANLIVTKTLVSESPPRPIDAIPVPAPPLPPAGDAPVSIDEPLPEPPWLAGIAEATYEIVMTNVSDVEMAGVTLLDAQLGGAVLSGAEPPATGADPLGRPTWELGALAAGDDARVLVTFGAPPDGNCANADDVAIVSATPAGGEREEYLAFADFGAPVGPCEFIQPDFCLYYPPGDGFPTGAPCEIDVCWAESPDGGELRSVFDCDAEIDYCWFLPPGEGFTALRPCADDVCWVSFGGGGFDGIRFEDEAFGGPGEYLSEFPCEIEFCQFTAPDGSYSTRSECDFPVCWTVPPGSSEYQPYYDCTGTTDTCWFSPPGAGRPELFPCSEDICWLSFADGFDFSFALPCDGERGLSLCKFTSPDGAETTTGSCDFLDCWTTPPGSTEWQRHYDCSGTTDLCWFGPPGPGEPLLSLCSEDICWLVAVGDTFRLSGPSLCGQDRIFCQFTAPDGSATRTERCDSPPCWSSPPEGGVWEQIRNCDEFESWCWFSPPAASGGSILNPCDLPVRFATNLPPGAIDTGSGLLPVFDEGEICWPIPLSDGPFTTFPIPCADVEFLYWYDPADGGPKAPVPEAGLIDACLDLPPDAIEPPDPRIPFPCPISEPLDIGEPGTSIPAEVVDGVSTPAELVPGTAEEIAALPSASVTPAEPVPGTVEEIAPQPSVSVTPAEIVPGTVEVLETLRSAEIIPAILLPSSRVEQVEGPFLLPIDDEIPRGPGDSPDGDNIISFPPSPDETLVTTLPDSGTGGVRANGGAWSAAFGLAAAAALAATLGVAIRQRRRL